MKQVNIITLGCKVNQCESAAMKQLLSEAGYREAADGRADIIIINTCTVTGRAAMQSRQVIRQAVRDHPQAGIVVTGCYAQTRPAEIADIAGVDLIVGHTDKLEVPAYLRQLAEKDTRPTVFRQPFSLPGRFSPLPLVSDTGRTRAFLKIQDGCNTFCTYCIVPHARGRSRSMPLPDVIEHLDRLGDDGFREVVLTGIHLGTYGLDLDPPTSLARLLEQVVRRPSVDRIRLSSIEPTEIDDTIIRLISDPQSILCPHVHIPLQSGDNHVLERMGRPYSREFYKNVVLNIRDALPRAAIGADVMVGFPGEDEDAFINTFRLVEELPLTYLHVFPFSPRKGTLAARFKQKVPERVAKERSRSLRELGLRKREEFFRTQIGQGLRVLVETRKDPDTGLAKGLSDNYIPVLLADATPDANQLVDVHITDLHAGGALIGIPVSRSAEHS